MKSDLEQQTLSTVNEFAKIGITRALDEIPFIGGILSAVVEVFWPTDIDSKPEAPTPQEIFNSIKDQIQDLVQDAITEDDINTLQAKYVGIGKVIRDFHNEIDPTPDNFFTVMTEIDKDLPLFKVKGHEVDYLPLYAAAVNGWLALLRDGAMLWPGKESVYPERLTDEIKNACDHVDTYYRIGLEKKREIAAKQTGAQAFNTVNDYIRRMTLSVLDYRELWPFFDSKEYPKPVKYTFTREIYGSAQGILRTDPIHLPTAPKGPIESITTWAKSRLTQLEVTYAENEGPDGKTTTGVMGVEQEKPSYIETEGVVVTKITSYVGEITDGIQLSGLWNGNDWTSSLAGSKGNNPGVENSIDGHIVSSIYLNGHRYWRGWWLPDTIVIGFKMAQPENSK